ncbi:solute carrier family 46 member 3-like isoform X2 [Acanthaster planci]|uniref:Solute carrier family 46 member 3-like isoform X2 n=1 Tax=Acanthaster planci TaxID=133434 RepID=A0A8B7Z734_ACAPL|nr:solute carrier family 46 member 3-like isoform X2 [Acanthaster planci]
MASHLLALCMHTLAIFRNPSTGEWNGVLIVEAITFFAYTHLGVFFLAMLQIVMLGEPFCWSPILIGYFSAAKLTGMTVVAKILQTWFDDYGLIQIGLLSMFTSALIPVYARTDAGLFLVAVFGAFRLVPGPILTSSLSKLVKKSSMGSVFGLTSAVECLGAFLAPTIYGTIYQATVEDDPMFVFKLMAGLTAIPSALVLFLQCWKCTSGAANYNEVKEEKLLPTSTSKQ